jgi:hypothetical protein
MKALMSDINMRDLNTFVPLSLDIDMFKDESITTTRLPGSIEELELHMHAYL